MSDTGEWKIGYQDEKHRREIEEEYKADTQLEKRWKNFEIDVTHDPYYHPKHKRIVKLKDTKSFPDGTYRYRNDPIRVVYYPEGTNKIIYPLEVATVTTVSYKKRSRRH